MVYICIMTTKMKGGTVGGGEGGGVRWQRRKGWEVGVLKG